MERQTETKIILVIRPTRLDDLVVRYNTVAQAQFYVEHLGADFADYLREDRQYKQAVTTTEASLRRLGRVQRLQRGFLPNFLFGEHDLVVVLGQDGLVANTLKYLHEQWVVGVNPDPGRWDGVLLPFAVGDLDRVVREVLAGGRKVTQVTMAQADLSDGQRLYAVNDLFIGARTHVSARYQLRWGDRTECQSSSGIIVSTGLGSTGWLRSVLAGAAGITSALADRPLELPPPPARTPWDAPYLAFSVREPFPSRTTGTSVVFGRVTAAQPLQLVSQMPENGVIFSDGIEQDFLAFTSGQQATVTVADKCGHLVA